MRSCVRSPGGWCAPILRSSGASRRADAAPVLAPHLYFALERAERRLGAEPVAAGEVGGAQFNRLGAGKGYAVVVVRDLGGRWRAVMLVLRRTETGHGRWWRCAVSTSLRPRRPARPGVREDERPMPPSGGPG